MRRRYYGSELEPLVALTALCPETRISGSKAYVGQFASDGLQQFARVDVPRTAPPPKGYPAVVFLHGWVGAANAPNWRFGCNKKYVYEPVIEAFANAGFVVLTPGYRGHGTVAGKVADGIEYLQRWDNGSYVIPNFYAVDVLNLISGVERTGHVLNLAGESIPVDPHRFFLKGHSQGGDVAMVILAVASGPKKSPSVAAASVWAGTFADRVTQATYYNSMQSSAQAFLDGDGRWSGVARGQSGKINLAFQFGYPPLEINTPDPTRWTWQSQQWKLSVSDAYRVAVRKISDALAPKGFSGADYDFSIEDSPSGKIRIRKNAALGRAVAKLDGAVPAQIGLPLILHFSDHDYYSPPQWNIRLCSELAKRGSQCKAFLYPGNTHELGVSSSTWFSPLGSRPGFDLMLIRDIEFYRKFPGAN